MVTASFTRHGRSSTCVAELDIRVELGGVVIRVADDRGGRPGECIVRVVDREFHDAGEDRDRVGVDRDTVDRGVEPGEVVAHVDVDRAATERPRAVALGRRPRTVR
jgi:hypothetical protein